MKKTITFSFCLAAATLMLSAALGDTLITKSGSKYKGIVIKDGDNYILIKPSGGRMTFPGSMVREVIKDTSPTTKTPATKPALKKPQAGPVKSSATRPAARPPKARPAAPAAPVILTPLPKPVKRPGIKRTVFASPFENATGKEQYDPAAAGLADMVAVMLGHQKGIAVVERQRLMALTAEQERALKGLTGTDYAVKAGKLLWADTVLTGRLFLIQDKMTVSVKAIDIATERVVASDQISCRPTYLMEASLQIARKLAEQMKLPLPEIDLEKIDKSPIASLHFAKALSHYYAGNMDAAIMQFMRTIDLDPDYIEAHYWSGMAYQRLREYPHAVIEWQKYLKRIPEGTVLAKDVGRLLAEAKRHEKDSTVKRLGPSTDKGGK